MESKPIETWNNRFVVFEDGYVHFGRCNHEDELACFSESGAAIISGGRWWHDSKNKTIWLFGQSDVYGKFDESALAQSLLGGKYPAWAKKKKFGIIPDHAINLVGDFKRACENADFHLRVNLI